jgi:hypothetical protein
MRSVVRMRPYRPWSLAGSYLERMVLPMEVSVVISSVTSFTGQVLAVSVLAASDSATLSSWSSLAGDLGWRDCREGVSSLGDSDIVLVGGECSGCWKCQICVGIGEMVYE